MILAGTEEEGRWRRETERILTAARKASDLTSQLLAFSRKQTREVVALDLNEVIRHLEEMLRRLIGEDIELVTSLEEGLGSIECDPGQIEQVIMNLAVNARDAMPEGGRLIIETREVELTEEQIEREAEFVVRPGPYAELCVTDTGIGMDAETLDRIFDPFFTTKEMGKGTGLGLSTVYGIVKQADGYIWVYSESEEGTTFKIQFPRVEAQPAPFEEDEERAPEQGAGEHVLVVEDEEALRDLVREVLTKAGYRVMAADSSSSALDIVGTEQPIDLVVSDVIMPGGSAADLAEEIRRTRPGTPILFMSGYPGQALSSRGDVGDGPFISKPFSMDEFLLKVQEVLREGEA